MAAAANAPCWSTAEAPPVLAAAPEPEVALAPDPPVALAPLPPLPPLLESQSLPVQAVAEGVSSEGVRLEVTTLVCVQEQLLLKNWVVSTNVPLALLVGMPEEAVTDGVARSRESETCSLFVRERT